jgi:DNA-binding SARP family transcriptional activator
MFRMCAFGDPILSDEDGRPLNGIMRRTKLFALLIFLACDQLDRPHRREEVVAIFWPESDGSRGRNSLRQSLHILREELGPDLLDGNGSPGLSVNRSRITCDVEAFTQAVDAGWPEAALDAYKADFLSGFSLPDSPEFGAWADERRYDLRVTAATVARGLALQAEEERRLTEALTWWRRTLRHRPFDEVVMRRIGSLLAWSGNRGQAVSELEAFGGRMTAELGLGPSGETLDLLEKISAGRIDDIDEWAGHRKTRWSRGSKHPWRRRADYMLGDPDAA